ncbi:MAG: hypothetical protein KAS96_01085 [Planctomycetes bacterium]|nr:hypothetical protein [Planctomycetota bacterium]
MSNNTKFRSVCPFTISRRNFLASTAAMAAASQMGLLDFASSVFASEIPSTQKSKIKVAFIRPNVRRTWLGWPGAAYDQVGMQKQYTKVITKAAKKMGIDLDIENKPLYDEKTTAAFLDSVKKDKPDGILVTNMNLNMGWNHADKMAKPQNRSDIPMVIFSPVGSSFTGHLQNTRNIEGCFVGATADLNWLGTGLRLLNSIPQMARTRLCIASGDKTNDIKLRQIGTTLHYIPESRFSDELKKIKTTKEMKAIADYYSKNARKIVEPTKGDILEAVRNYIVCKKLMADENCHGFSMNCLGLVGSKTIQPPCLAFSKLRDEGIVGCCEADWPAAISSRLTHLLTNRPGFMQDPAPDTVNNTLVGAHCTCGAKLNGFDKPDEPFILRSHSESDLGVAPQVLWRLGQKVTVMKYICQGSPWDPPLAKPYEFSMVIGTGTVVGNIDTPPSGGCRTSVELKMDDIKDTRDTKGFHQLFIYGDYERTFKAYCQLAKIKAEHI